MTDSDKENMSISDVVVKNIDIVKGALIVFQME